jgi:arylsulfatase A-like enzyme
MRTNIPEAPWEGDPLPSDPGDIGEEVIRRKMLQSYYASVSYSDFLLGKLLQKIADLDIEDNTIIAIISDHGFHIFDHDLWNKTTQFRHSTRSVAYIHAPSFSQEAPSGKVDNPVELVDFYPTLIDLCGLDIPESTQGSSLVPVLEDLKREIKPYAYSQFSKNRQMGYTLVNQNYRYTAWLDDPDGINGPCNSGPEYGDIMMEELYDLMRDPQETRNVAWESEYTGIRAKLKQDLMHFVKKESAADPF